MHISKPVLAKAKCQTRAITRANLRIAIMQSEFDMQCWPSLRPRRAGNDIVICKIIILMFILLRHLKMKETGCSIIKALSHVAMALKIVSKP